MINQTKIIKKTILILFTLILISAFFSFLNIISLYANFDFKKENNFKQQIQSIAKIQPKESPKFEEIKENLLDISDIKKFNSKAFAFTIEGSSADVIDVYDPRTLAKHSYITSLGYLMEFLGENNLNKNFYNIRFQGNILAINKKNINLIDAKFIQSFPHYVNDGGYVHHIIENNPLKPNSWYMRNILGKAPNWMKPGVKYYSFSGIYFTENPMLLGNLDMRENSVNFNNPYYDAYLYKPLRSKTSYSAYDLNKAFKQLANNNNIYNSKMFSTGYDFLNIQKRYGCNGMMILAMGIHESAFGTSNIAINRNNLFGICAYDSNPGEATRFNSVGECINFQGNSLSFNYADADYQDNKIYYGCHLGNKSSGMNVKYASDPFWGEKIANYYAQMDRYLGEKDYNNEKIAILPQGTDIYWLPNFISSQYAHKYKGSTSTLEHMYPVVLKDKNTILLEPPYRPDKQVSSKRDPDGGVFNNYLGYFKNTDYYLVNDNIDNDDEFVIQEGNLKFYLNNRKEKIIKYAEEYENNKVVRIYEYYTGTKYGNNHYLNVQFIFHLNNDQTLKLAKQYPANTGPNSHNSIFMYEYFPGTKYKDNHHLHIELLFSFGHNEQLISAKQYANNKECTDNNALAVFEYYPNTFYGNKHYNHISHIYKLKENAVISSSKKYLDNQPANNNAIKAYEYHGNVKYGQNHPNRIQFIFNLKENESIVDTYQYLDNASLENKNICGIFEYYPQNKYGYDHQKHIKSINQIKEGFIINSKYYNDESIPNENNAFCFKEYYPNTLYEKKDNHLRFNHKLKENELIINTKEYLDNEINLQNYKRVYEYYPNTCTKDKHEEKRQLIFHISDDEKIDHTDELFNKEVINVYKYYKDTKYEKEHYKHIKDVYNLKINDKTLNYSSHFKDLTTNPYKSYIYQNKINYNPNESHFNWIKQEFFYTGANIDYSFEYENGFKPKIIQIYEYFSNTNLDNYKDNYQLMFCLNNMYLTKAYEFLNNRKIINIYEYYENTMYKQQHHKKIRYVYNLKDNMVLNYAYERLINSDKNKYKYYFKENTIYGDNHWSKLISKHEVD